MIHFEAPHISIQFDSKTHSVIMEWKQFVRGDEFRSALDMGLNLLVQQGSSKWLADMRNMGVVAVDDQVWANIDWFPRAVKIGIRKMALVMPQSIVAQSSVIRIMRRVDGINIETAMFDNQADAKQWLVSLNYVE
jgi:SpoIIAA-like